MCSSRIYNFIGDKHRFYTFRNAAQAKLQYRHDDILFRAKRKRSVSRFQVFPIIYYVLFYWVVYSTRYKFNMIRKGFYYNIYPFK